MTTTPRGGLTLSSRLKKVVIFSLFLVSAAVGYFSHGQKAEACGTCKGRYCWQNWVSAYYCQDDFGSGCHYPFPCSTLPPF